MKIQVTTKSGAVYTVHISKGNSKMGPNCWNISKRPVIDCPAGVPCARDCYAMKAFRMYPNVSANWTDNSEFCAADLPAYHDAIRSILDCKKQPTFFRWHVAGDLSNYSDFVHVCMTAEKFPKIRFLIFTKRHAVVNEYLESSYIIPDNLSVVFSSWPGMPFENPFNLPVAYMQDGTETRIPADAIACPGGCDGCGMCWSLKQLKRDVYFPKH